MRDLSLEDKLFLEFKFHADERALENLIINVNSWLYAIVFSFVMDEEKTEDILDCVILELIKVKARIDPNITGVIYEIYKIAKKEIFRD